MGPSPVVEYLAIEQFVTPTANEAFDVPILPRAPGLNVDGDDAQPAEPFANGVRAKFGAVIGPDGL